MLVTGVWLSKYELVALIALVLSGHGLTNPNANALSLAPVSKHAGSAASLAGSFRMGMGGLVSALVSVFHNGTAVPMIAVMVICIFLALLILLAGTAALKSIEEQRRDFEKDPSVVM
jgi:DHA1 family bicyclomycin/chloramphenicol resistance-like MFS transporter